MRATPYNMALASTWMSVHIIPYRPLTISFVYYNTYFQPINPLSIRSITWHGSLVSARPYAVLPSVIYLFYIIFNFIFFVRHLRTTDEQLT